MIGTNVPNYLGKMIKKLHGEKCLNTNVKTQFESPKVKHLLKLKNTYKNFKTDYLQENVNKKFKK